MVIKSKNNEIQLLRALAIIAVVCIHTCPLGMSQVFIRPFINFAVALFVFLSGYLTRIENSDWVSFYKRRINRVLIPYIIWTSLYTLYDTLLGAATISLIPINLVFASARGHLYYIPVYIGLVLITPFLGRLIKSRFHHIAWTIAPIYIIFTFYTRFIPQIQIDPVVLNILDLCFFGWFSYYYLGILLGNNLCQRKWSPILLCVLLVISLLMQISEAYVIYNKFNFTNCGTQVKLSTLLTNMIFLLVVYVFLSTNKISIKSNFLRKIGDYSFGIYLSHILIINVLSSYSIFSFYKSLPFPINSMIILLVSFVFCCCCDRILSSRVCKYLGIK